MVGLAETGNVKFQTRDGKKVTGRSNSSRERYVLRAEFLDGKNDSS